MRRKGPQRWVRESNNITIESEKGCAVVPNKKMFVEACIAFASTCTAVNALIPFVYHASVLRNSRRRRRELYQQRRCEVFHAIELPDLHAE